MEREHEENRFKREEELRSDEFLSILMKIMKIRKWLQNPLVNQGAPLRRIPARSFLAYKYANKRLRRECGAPPLANPVSGYLDVNWIFRVNMTLQPPRMLNGIGPVSISLNAFPQSDSNRHRYRYC